MQVSIIISTKDRGQIFTEALRCALAAIEHIDGEIIVINDSKTSIPAIPTEAESVTLVNNPKSGVASARNLGASIARGDLLIFMDDDFIIPPESVGRIVKDSLTEPKKIHLYNWVYPPELQSKLLESQFGRYLHHFGFTSVKGWLGNEWEENRDVFELKDGASYFLPIEKSLFQEIGGYNENFPHSGAEDYDFIQRAKKAGIRFYLDKTLTLYHNELDKLDYRNWMNRKKRNGETIGVAVESGYEELRFHYPYFKRVLLRTAWRLRFFLFGFEKAIPNRIWLDFIYFRITNILLAIYLFDGYRKGSVR
jgi:glycosyltransferase involved in cell wall biosynthesis